MLLPSGSITTNTSLVSMSLGVVGIHGGRDSSVPTTVMRAMDEGETNASASASWNVSAHSRSYPLPHSPTLTSAAFCLIPIQ
jgi:hypothetical protein